ncbi:AroM family protein [Amphritea sp. HPY]|uniref:AroM family protein n=1 Tax=Amphritea sp. HPY TaxID=3421652 RepID=UPI003D7CA9DF
MNKVEVVLYSRYSGEIAEFVRQHLETDAEYNISGALDGLSDTQLREMAADPIATGVPVELSDGEWLYIDHKQIDQRARSVIETLKADGTDTVMMCCTLPWHSLETLPGVICPNRVMEANAVALLPRGAALGVVLPDSNTAVEEIKHWQALDVPVLNTTISPHENSLDELTAACVKLVEQGAELIVLDCLAFTRDHWQQVRKATGKPILLPMSVMGKLLDEAYGQV